MLPGTEAVLVNNLGTLLAELVGLHKILWMVLHQLTIKYKIIFTCAGCTDEIWTIMVHITQYHYLQKNTVFSLDTLDYIYSWTNLDTNEI